MKNWKINLIHKLGGYSEEEFSSMQTTMEREIDSLCDRLRDNCIEMTQNLKHTVPLKGIRHVHNEDIENSLDIFKREIAEDIGEELLEQDLIQFDLAQPEEGKYYHVLTGTVNVFK